MEDDLRGRVGRISALLAEVVDHEQIREKDLREKMKRITSDRDIDERIDENRLEQEILLYLEKLDIHEEKIRLSQHCQYFDNTITGHDSEKGKKLGFIAQEMGREINTLSSKAQYAPLQKIVVEMKVELDQIKEQLANVL